MTATIATRPPGPDHGSATPARASDRGTTLVEMLVAITVIGLAFPILIGAFGVSALLSGRDATRAGEMAAIRSSTEYLRGLGYVECAVPGDYQSPAFAVFADDDLTVTVLDVDFWDGGESAVFTESCGTDTGVQLITIQATSTLGISVTYDLAKRKP